MSYKRHASLINQDEEEDPDSPPLGSYTRSRRDRSILSEDDPLNQPNPSASNTPLNKPEPRPTSVIPPHDDDEEEEQQEEEIEESLTRERANKIKMQYDVEETLLRENKMCVFEGYLERKTNQKVLGKHLWETRYFKLSTHSLSIYINNKTAITESIIKLSSITSINRNVKSDGTDLKENRFDINTSRSIINLRTENSALCQQWIHILSEQRKKHRQSIRNGLETLDGGQSMIKRYKRNRTKREHAEESTSIRHVRIQTEDIPLNRTKSIKETVEFEGFVIRRIGYDPTKIGEKIYFKLSDDALEFSRIEEDIDDVKESLRRKHQSNILGSISIEHIKNVKMIDENDEEFIIVFNEHNSSNDWIIKDKGNAKEWVNVLSKAQKEAEYVAKQINRYQDKKISISITNDDDDDSTDDSDSDQEYGTNTKRKKRRKLGGTIKALQNMINDETIDELEAARNQDLDNQKLVNGFEINNLENTNQINTKTITNGGNCSCLCFK